MHCPKLHRIFTQGRLEMSRVESTYMQKGLIIALLCAAVLFSAHPGASASTYELGPGDIITITIFAGGEEQVQTSLIVSDQGIINAPFIGAVKAAGHTVSSLESMLYQPLERDYFVDPQVHIQVKEYNSLQYSISGAVNNPGNYVMKSATTLMELIAKAGGATTDRGNVAYIMRDEEKDSSDKREPLKVNLKRLLDEGDMTHNVALRSGDAVYIPLSKGLKQTESKVYVAGKVKNPGLHDYQPGLTALSVCIMAGGFAEFAAPNRATIVRTEGEKQQVIKINLEKVIEGKVADILLKPGDRLYIPESWL